MLALPVSVSQRVPKILMQYTILFFYCTFKEQNITTHIKCIQIIHNMKRPNTDYTYYIINCKGAWCKMPICCACFHFTFKLALYPNSRYTNNLRKGVPEKIESIQKSHVIKLSSQSRGIPTFHSGTLD